MKKLYAVLAVVCLAAGCQTAQVKAPPAAPDYLAALGLKTFTAEPLLPYLASSEPQVRAGASQAIRALADPAALEALIQIAGSRADATVRAAAVESFWRTEDPRVADVLRAAAADGSDVVRRAAYVAMGNVANPALLDVLIESVDKELAATSPNISPYSTTPMVQSAINALGSFSSRKATQKLLALLKDGNRQVRQHAAEAVRRTRGGEGLSDVIDFLEANPDPGREDYHYYQLIELLRGSTDPRLPAVMLALFDSSNQSVRSSAGMMLSQVANQTILDPVKEMLEKGRTPKGRTLTDNDLYMLLQAAAAIGSPSLAKPLAGHLKSDREMVVSQTAAALERCVDIAVTEEIVKAWQDAKKDTVRNSMRSLVSSGTYPITWDQEANSCEVDRPRLRALRGEPEPEPEPEQEPAAEQVPSEAPVVEAALPVEAPAPVEGAEQAPSAEVSK